MRIPKRPLYIFGDMNLGKVHRLTADDAEKLRENQKDITGPFRTWNDILLFQIAKLGTWFYREQFPETRMDDANRCEICGAMSHQDHETDCPKSPFHKEYYPAVNGE